MLLGAFVVILVQGCFIAALLWRRSPRENRRALRSQEHARRLAGRIIAAQEVERARIARELHDDLSQKVALLIIDIRQTSLGSPGMAARLQVMAERAAELGTDLHNLSHDLHPAKLRLLGLAQSTKCLCRDVAGRHSITVDFDHEGLPAAVPSDAALCLFRIVEEALRNVVKHSGATYATVRLSGSHKSLDLEICDTGRGFDPSKPMDGVGLLSMRERVNFLDGAIAVRSAPGAGTRIAVRVPICTDQAVPGPVTRIA